MLKLQFKRRSISRDFLGLLILACASLISLSSSSGLAVGDFGVGNGTAPEQDPGLNSEQRDGLHEAQWEEYLSDCMSSNFDGLDRCNDIQIKQKSYGVGNSRHYRRDTEEASQALDELSMPPLFE